MNNTPQLEDGFIRLATGIPKALAKLHLNSYQSRVLWVIFLKTYGFQKKEDWISNSQFVEITGIRPSHISRTVSELLGMNIVTKRGNKIAFQKDSKLWKKLPNGVRRHDVTKRGNTVTKRGISLLPNGGDTIDTITKDTYTKDNTCNKLLFLFKSVNPSYKILFNNKTQRTSLNRMIAQYGEEKMTNLISNLHTIVYRPYAPQITTPYELEVKMGKLIQFLKQEKLKIASTGTTKI